MQCKRLDMSKSLWSSAHTHKLYITTHIQSQEYHTHAQSMHGSNRCAALDTNTMFNVHFHCALYG